MPGVQSVRGSGLLLGIVLSDQSATRVVDVAREEGLLLNAPSSSVIRIAPALTLTDGEAKIFIKKFSKVLDRVQNGDRQ